MMRPFAHTRLPMCRFTVWLLLLGLLLCGGQNVFAADEVGVYWDAGYTSSTADTPAVPGIITGYVVLHDPSGGGGVLGWEACFDIEGPGLISGWDFQGQGVNAGTDGCVAVGYVDPLPAAANILLGTFTCFASDPGPILLGMEPDYSASLPGEMSYIPGDDPGALVVMRTVTGRPAVAGLNGGNPWVSLSPTELDFGPVPFAQSRTLAVTITNQSSAPVPLDLSITAFCDFFTVTGSVPTAVPADSLAVIEVSFSPVQAREVFCELDLGPDLPVVGLRGSGFEPVAEWQIIGNGSFGYVNVGQAPTRTVTLRNTGQTVLSLDPVFVSSCADFTLLAGDGVGELAPLEEIGFTVQFAPTSPGYQACYLDTGVPGMANLLFEGFGRNPVTSWQVPTEFDFLQNYVGVPATGAITILNDGDTVIPVFAAISDSCAEFSVTQGGGYEVQLQPGQTHAVQIRFVADAPGHFECDLDLGDVVPAVALRGDAVAGPGSLTVNPELLVFTNTMVGQYQDRDVIVRNLASYDVGFRAALSLDSGAYGIIAGGNTVTLAPGETHAVTIRFSPSGPILYEEVLVLGAAHPVVQIQGTGFLPDPNCRLEPAALDFGTVNLGQSAELPVTVHNDGNTSLLLEPQTDDPAFFIDAPPVQLAPGQSHTFDILFQPTALGGSGGSLVFGNISCGAVPLSGAAVLAPHQFQADPDTVDIPAVPVNTIVDRDVVVTNLSGYTLDLDVELLDPTYGFTLLEGGGTGVLYSGDSRLVRLRFQCLTEQTYATHLSFGPGLPLVPIFAEGVVVRPDCEQERTDVNFGSVVVGSTRYRYVGITNNSDTLLRLDPEVLGEGFEASVDVSTVAPGQSVSLTIAFHPVRTGVHTAAVLLGDTRCEGIQLFGEATPGANENVNQLGIYWDERWWSNNVNTYIDNQVVTGYLVLSLPSEPGGVMGWECRLEKDGPALALDWVLEGQAVNIGAYPEFVVGLASPLPPAPETLLASFTCFVPSPWDATLFSLFPIQRASIPDRMSWVAGSAPDLLIPMGTVTGFPLVADINGSSPVAVELPTPLADLRGGQVDLSWTLPTGTWDGCHVYRRADGNAEAARLTTTPLPGEAGRLVFTDLTSGLTPGATYFYSYAAVKDGAERGRSPEVAVEMPPYRPLATRLLPNVPNPFNPMTEIRFELGKAQRVDLRIYDVTGRLVRTLVDRELTHGPHAEVWQGRDDAGRPVPSGAYYVRLVTGEGVDKRKIMLLK